MSKSKKNKENEREISRRRFLNLVGNSAVAASTLGALGVSLKFLSPNVLLEIPTRFKAGTLESLLPGDTLFDDEHHVFIFRDKKGYFYALSAICTHLGCTTNWKAEGDQEYPEGVIACPCHGSVFGKTGDVLKGPATRALDRFRLWLENGKLIVDTAETVSEEEMILRV